MLLVHYGGNPADMDRVMALTRPRGITVVEDSAHAIGALYRGRRPGSLADIGCFSFHSTKNLTTLGEGGMITLSRDDWAERVARIRDNEVDGVYVPRTGAAPDRPALLPWMKFADGVYRHTAVGIRGAGTNATMSEAAAAVGLVQLGSLDRFVERRTRIAARLDEAVSAFPGCACTGRPRTAATPTTCTRSSSPEAGRCASGSSAPWTASAWRSSCATSRCTSPRVASAGPPSRRVPARGAHLVRGAHEPALPPGLTDAQVDHMVAAVRRALREAYDELATVPA